jgi:hypothetical protein
MARCRHFLPGFRATCLGVGVTFALLAASQLAQGVPASMAGFGVPDAVLNSPHYKDAMTWVFVHMFVLGLIIGVVGYFAEVARTRRAFAGVTLACVAIFTALDIHTSDSPLGNGLYAGARSLVPPVIDLVVIFLFAHLFLCKTASQTPGAPTTAADEH